MGCSDNWQPDCLRGWMTDVDNDGTYTFVTEDIPGGNYEGKAAIGEGWNNPNFPAGNIRLLRASSDCSTSIFSFVDATDTMTIDVYPASAATAMTTTSNSMAWATTATTPSTACPSAR